MEICGLRFNPLPSLTFSLKVNTMNFGKDLNQNMSIICALLDKRQQDIKSIKRGNAILKQIRGN